MALVYHIFLYLQVVGCNVCTFAGLNSLRLPKFPKCIILSGGIHAPKHLCAVCSQTQFCPVCQTDSKKTIVS